MERGSVTRPVHLITERRDNMTTIIAAFVVGAIVGATLGILVSGLCVAASRNAADSDTPEYY